jgi:hypothetical protein
MITDNSNPNPSYNTMSSINRFDFTQRIATDRVVCKAKDRLVKSL